MRHSPRHALSSIRLGMTGAILLSFAGIAQAQTQSAHGQPPQAPDFNWFGFFSSQPSAPGLNWELYNRSGTLGRQGLGASPQHPEGPGNASY